MDKKILGLAAEEKTEQLQECLQTLNEGEASFCSRSQSTTLRGFINNTFVWFFAFNKILITLFHYLLHFIMVDSHLYEPHG